MPQNNVDLVNIYSPAELTVLTPAQVQAATFYVCVYPELVQGIANLNRVNIASLLQTMINDRLGGGPPNFYQALAFSTSVKFDHYITKYEDRVISGPLTFTPNPTGAKAGSEAVLRLIADGVNLPVFQGFSETNGSAQYDNRSGILNVVNCYYDGTEYWYSVFQRLSGQTTAPVDTTAPTLSSVSIDSASPGVVVLTYSETLNTTAPPAASAYVFSGGATAQSVAFANGNQIRVTFTPVLGAGSSRTVAYVVPGTNPVRDPSNNPAAAFAAQTFSLPANPPADTTPPTLVSVAFDAAESAGRVRLIYSESLNTTTTPPNTAYTISDSSTVQSISFVNGNEILVNFTPDLAEGESRTVAYAVPGTSPVRDPTGNPAPAFGPQSFSRPAAPAVGQQPLTFVNRTTNISQNSDGLVATSPSFANTYALGDFYIPAGVDGNFEMAILSTANRNVLIGLNLQEINEGIPGYEYFVWLGGSSGDIKKGTNGNTNEAVTGIVAAIGSKIRIGRFGGIIKGQYASNGTTFTDFHTWGADSARFYLNVAMAGTTLSQPKVTGGLPR